MRAHSRALSAACMLLLGSTAHACMTLDDAAKAALAEAVPLSAEHEYGGALYVKSDGCHGFTAPATSGSKYNVELHLTLPVGGHLAGIYHTHPGLPHQTPEKFSYNDVHVHVELDVPSYIGVVRTGDVYVLDAGIGNGALRRAMRSKGSLLGRNL